MGKPSAARKPSSAPPSGPSAVLERVQRMLESPDVELACAAARILGELGPDQDGTYKALCKGIQRDNTVVVTYALDALGRSLNPDRVDRLLPLLDAEDTVRAKAVEILKGMGPEAIETVREFLRSGTVRQQRALVEVLGSSGNSGTFESLLDGIVKREESVVRKILAEITRRLPEIDAAGRKGLRARLERVLSDRSARKSPALPGLLELYVQVAGTDVVPLLLTFLDRSVPAEARREVMGMLAGVGIPAPEARKVQQMILPFLQKGDPGEVAAALGVLAKTDFRPSQISVLRKLLAHADVGVRYFALDRLAVIENPTAARALVDFLRATEGADRQAAERALGRNAAGVPLLLSALSGRVGGELGWSMGRALTPHVATGRKESARAVERRFLQLVGKKDAAAEILAEVLRNGPHDRAVRDLLKKGAAARRGKKFAEAAHWAGLLLRIDPHHVEGRYLRAASTLQSSAREIAPRSRIGDPGLRQFAALWRQHRDEVENLLRKDKILKATDLYYLGFHFAEMPGREGELGQTVLQILVRRHPKHKTAATAKSKLRTERKRK